jgi:DNA processing protein
MSEPACAACLRRSQLLATLGVSLDFACRDREKMLAVLALEDDELIRALGSRHRARAHASNTQAARDPPERVSAVQTICVHRGGYPQALRFPAAPRMLYLRGGTDRLHALVHARAVAIVGTAHATDYGMQVAKGLARSLTACGVTVVCACAEGIGLAALSGAVEGAGTVVCVIPGGIDVSCPAALQPALRQALRGGCAVGELPCGVRGRRWGVPASERIIAGLAALTVVVEAEDRGPALGVASIARALGRELAAVPGRVTALQSSGTNALLALDASLVRGPEDVLALLDCTAAWPVAAGGVRRPTLSPRLREVLEGVGAGRDTPEKLARGGRRLHEALLALSELELLGLLARGDGGRYLPRERIDGGGEVRRGDG